MKTFRIPILGNTVTILDKDQSVLAFLPELRGRLTRGENAPLVMPMHGPKWKRVLDLGRISQRFFEMELMDGLYGPVLSRRVVTDAGVAFLVDDWDNNAKDITNFNAHANGTGTTAEAVGQTALVTETGTRVSGTKSQPTAPQIRTVGTISQTGTAAITEHGIFDSTTAGGSTLWDRSVFSAINVQNGDSIEFTYTLTVNSGG